VDEEHTASRQSSVVFPRQGLLERCRGKLKSKTLTLRRREFLARFSGGLLTPPARGIAVPASWQPEGDTARHLEFSTSERVNSLGETQRSCADLSVNRSVLMEHSPLQPLSPEAPATEPTFASSALRTSLTAIFSLARIAAGYSALARSVRRNTSVAQSLLNPVDLRHNAAKHPWRLLTRPPVRVS
jgi:hypothetical protein